MKELKDRRILGCIVFLFICIVISFIMYGMNKDKVFKDEYMKDIFVEESNTEDILVNKENIEVNNIVVEIKGEVKKPDVYILKEGSIIKDLIDMADGLTEMGDVSNINRADKLSNHQLIFIPNKNDVNNIENTIIPSMVGKDDIGLININTASLEELKGITGIGDTKAQNIIDYRESNNGFTSIDDLKNVDGIGEKTFEKLKDEITH